MWLKTQLYCFQVLVDNPLLALSVRMLSKFSFTFMLAKISSAKLPLLLYFFLCNGLGDTIFANPVKILDFKKWGFLSRQYIYKINFFPLQTKIRKLEKSKPRGRPVSEWVKSWSSDPRNSGF